MREFRNPGSSGVEAGPPLSESRELSQDKAIARTFTVTVSSDGILNIEFVGANALISGIEIL